MPRSRQRSPKTQEFVRSRPNGAGEVSVYRYCSDGELRFQRIERIAAQGPSPLPSISVR